MGKNAFHKTYPHPGEVMEKLMSDLGVPVQVVAEKSTLPEDTVQKIIDQKAYPSKGQSVLLGAALGKGKYYFHTLGEHHKDVS